jgi:hypothetical protein
MIKHFNTSAIGGSSKGGSSKGMGAIVWIAILAVGGFFAYNYIKNKNTIVVEQQD